MGSKYVTFSVTLFSMLLASCSSILSPPPERTTFVILTQGVTPAGVNPDGAVPAGLGIGLGPVTLPQYLDRPEVVIRTSQNSIELSPTVRWAEPVTDNFRQVLAADLGRNLNTSHIVPYPWYSDQKLDYSVRVRVDRFETTEKKTAELSARWDIAEGDNGRTLVDRHSDISEPLSSSEPQSIAAGLSADTADLAEKITAAIADLRRNETTASSGPSIDARNAGATEHDNAK
jgi:uncharacterized protein